MEDKSYRHCASFGKRIEHYLIGQMLKEGLDVYIPMVDDDAIDAVVKRPDGKYVEIQIKARSKEVGFGDAALFAAIPHEHRENYWFVFYSERLDSMWIMSSAEFLKESNQNKSGKNVGKHSICFNGKKDGKPYCFEKYDKYKCTTFERINTVGADQCVRPDTEDEGAHVCPPQPAGAPQQIVRPDTEDEGAHVGAPQPAGPPQQLKSDKNAPIQS